MIPTSGQAWGNRHAAALTSALRFPKLLGVAALSSGAALVTHILTAVSLTTAVAFAGALMVATVAFHWRRAGPYARRWLRRRLAVGVLAGAVATAAYDGAKFILSRLDPSPYNPFEVVRVFGALLAGPAAPKVLAFAVGFAFHAYNGISFAVAYCLLFGRRGVWSGIMWGLFLESFQLVLYPDWLQVRYYREFAQISALSHIIYGMTLALCCRRGLPPRDEDVAWSKRTLGVSRA
jgi:hypothetical protein